MATLLKSTFKAWIDKMPGSGPKLIVIGKVEVPTTGWSGRLERASPQGFNPDILILDAKLKEPTEITNPVVSKIDLRYEEAPPGREYSQVTTRLGTDSVTVDVGTTH